MKNRFSKLDPENLAIKKEVWEKHHTSDKIFRGLGIKSGHLRLRHVVCKQFFCILDNFVDFTSWNLSWDFILLYVGKNGWLPRTFHFMMLLRFLGSRVTSAWQKSFFWDSLAMNREYQVCFIIKRYLSLGATDFSTNNKVINEGTRTMCDLVLVSLVLTLYTFRKLF